MIARPRNVLIQRLLVALLMLLAAAGLAACNRPGGDEPGSCDPEDLVAPDPTYPVHNSVISDLSPTFQWTYPDYSCLPSEYRVLVSTSLSWFDSSPFLAEATLPGTTTTWDPGLTLAPGDIYYFFVYAREGGVGPGRGIFFWTEPMCSDTGDAMQAPVLVAPANGERLTAMRAHLRWDDPTPCVSMYHYWVEISNSPTFAESYSIWTSIFEDHALPDDEFTLEPCTTYYWRVQARYGGGVPDGPYSGAWSFTTPTESGMACLTGPVVTPFIPGPGGITFPTTGNGAIAGHVFHDECAVPYESTDVAPQGCVIMPDGTIEANGILDSGESGIEGVAVWLNTGACPGSPGSSDTTDASGQFDFHNRTAGTYCLSIDAAADGNDAILIPGNWTMPYRWYGPGPISMEITLGSDDDISRLNDFGWDYQFLPSPSGGTPLARVLTDARCRLGPSFDYPILTYLSQGLSFPIIGRLEQGGWWQLRAPDLDKACWIGEDVVEPSGDLTKVPLAIPPELPTREPTKVPPSGCGCWEYPPNFPNGTCVYRDPCPAQCTKCP